MVKDIAKFRIKRKAALAEISHPKHLKILMSLPIKPPVVLEQLAKNGTDEHRSILMRGLSTGAVPLGVQWYVLDHDNVSHIKLLSKYSQYTHIREKARNRLKELENKK